MTKSMLPVAFGAWSDIAVATSPPRKDPLIRTTADSKASRSLEYIDSVGRATGQHLTPAQPGRHKESQ